MHALPVRRVASSALCAALLVGITGPAAMAADSARERSHAALPDAPLPGSNALRAQVRKLNAFGDELTPVTDLLNAVLKADNGQLPPAEARKMGDAAKSALVKADAKAPARRELRPAPTRGAAKPRVSERRAADPTSDALDAVEKALESLLQAVTSGDVNQVSASVDGLLTEVENLVAALIDSDLPDPTPPSTSTSTSVSPAPVVTLPEITLPTTVLLPAS